MSIRSAERSKGITAARPDLLQSKRTDLGGQLLGRFRGLMRSNPQESSKEQRSEEKYDESDFLDCRRGSSGGLRTALRIRRRIGQRYAHGGAFRNIDGTRIVVCFDRQYSLSGE